jgi:hypothetical protein
MEDDVLPTGELGARVALEALGLVPAVVVGVPRFADRVSTVAGTDLRLPQLEAQEQPSIVLGPLRRLDGAGDSVRILEVFVQVRRGAEAAPESCRRDSQAPSQLQLVSERSCFW